MVNNNKDIPQSKRRSDSEEEITRHNGLCVIAQQRRPLIPAGLSRQRLGCVLPNRSWRDSDTELHE